MISDVLLDVFLAHQIPDFYLFRLLELVFLLFLDIFLHYCIYFTTAHRLLDLLRQLVENTLVFYSNPEQSLLELLVVQACLVLSMQLLVFGEKLEYFVELFAFNDERIQLEDQSEVVPRVVS